MKSNRLLAVAFGLLFVLHQDFWLWDSTGSVFGVPAGFLFHIAYCIVVTLVLIALVGREHRELSRSGDSVRP